MQAKRTITLYPALLVFYFYLYFYSVNSTTLLFPIRTMLNYFVLTMAVTAVVWLGLTWLWKDVAKAAILVAVLLLLFFSYGHVYELIYFRKSNIAVYVGSEALLLRSHLILLFVWALFAISALMLTIARGHHAYRLTSTLNIVTGILCLFPILTLAANQKLFSPIFTEDRAQTADTLAIDAAAQGYEEGVLPDIYYIILVPRHMGKQV